MSRLAGCFDPRRRAEHAGRARRGGVRGGALGDGPLSFACGEPVVSPDGLVCVLDGFVDDAQELAAGLGLAGDARPEHLLAAGYRRWGRRLPEHLRGDFAIVVWDLHRAEGLLARDQLGVRCLYLHQTASGALCFASELSLLLDLLPATPPPDPASVAHWIAASSRPGSGTLYAGVRRLNPGAMLLLDAGGTRERTYWHPRFRDRAPLEFGQALEQVRGALGKAVERRLHGTGPAAVLMSGGLDSASVAALAARAAPGRVRALSGVFPEHPAVDESGLIAELARDLGVPCTRMAVSSGGLVQSAVEAASSWRLPLLGWGDCWTVPLLRAAARDGVEMTLGGDGGDELFGTREQLLADMLRAGRPKRAAALARAIPGAGTRPSRRAIARVLLGPALTDALPLVVSDARWRIGMHRHPPRWLLAASVRDLLDTDRPYEWMSLDGPRWWGYAAHGLTRGVEERGVFEHQRLRAETAGVHARHPLFDLDLLELILQLPPQLSFDAHRSRPLLRGAMEGLLPESVRMRPGKAWFDSLILDSLTGPDAAPLRRLLADRSAELGAYADLGVVRGMLDNGPGAGTARFSWMHTVWRLLTAECWLRELAGRASPLGGPVAAAGVEQVASPA